MGKGAAASKSREKTKPITWAKKTRGSSSLPPSLRGTPVMSPGVVVSPTAVGHHGTRGEWSRWRHNKSVGGGDGGEGGAKGGGGLMTFIGGGADVDASGDDKGVHQHKKDYKKVSFTVAMVGRGPISRE